MERKASKLQLTTLLILILLPIAHNLKAISSYTENPPDERRLTLSNNDVILISKSVLIKAGRVTFGAEDSDFSSAFRVVSFTVSAKIGAYEESYEQTNGPRFTQQQLNLIKKVKSKSKVYIENIKAIGPGGEIRNLGSIVFKIK